MPATIPKDNLVPAKVVRWLTHAEIPPIAVVRYHPISLVGPVGSAVLGFIVACVLTAAAVANGATVLVDLIWIGWVLLALRATWKILNWMVTYFTITPFKFIEVGGVFGARVRLMPINRVTDMGVDQSWVAKRLRYATWILESAGQDQALSRIQFVPFPDQLYIEVMELINQVGHEEDDDGEDDGT
jgi:uncharacterized membrane protein YdbT with pleckstrin-like domain